MTPPKRKHLLELLDSMRIQLEVPDIHGERINWVTVVQIEEQISEAMRPAIHEDLDKHREEGT